MQAERIYSDDIGFGFDTEKMWEANNEKRKNTNNIRNTTTKSWKIQNAQRKGNLQYLRILEADTIKQIQVK